MTARATMTNAIENGIRQKLKNVNTAIPGYVLNFDPSTQLAEIQVAIERIDIEGNSEKWSPIVACPVHFAGGKFVLEHQIDIGDEGLVIFSQRCIDAWLDQGGVAPQSRIQFHNGNDAMFVPGLRSQPNKIENFQNNGIRLRDDSGTNYIWLKNDGNAEIDVSTLFVKGNIVHEGDQTTTGTINADTEITTPVVSASASVTAPTVTGSTSVSAGGKEMANHTHPAGTPPGNTGPNN